jgi:hypothetical protein
MKKSTTITYNTETCGGVSTSSLEYKDYVKDEKGEENLLHYRAKNVMSEVNEDSEANTIKAIGNASNASNASNAGNAGNAGNARDARETSELTESFNMICKIDDTVDETIGVSSNNNEWKIREYKNHKLDKQYIQEYDAIKFDIKLDKCDSQGSQGTLGSQGYIKDKL